MHHMDPMTTNQGAIPYISTAYHHFTQVARHATFSTPIHNDS